MKNENTKKLHLISISSSSSSRDAMMMTMWKTIKNVIGVIIVVGLVSWLGYEISTMRADLTEGAVWMAPFL